MSKQPKLLSQLCVWTARKCRASLVLVPALFVVMLLGFDSNRVMALPIAPTGVTAVAGSNQITLSWNAVAGATSYKVNRSSTSGSSYNLVSSPTTTSFVDTGPQNGSTRYYVIAAVDGTGTGPNSLEVSATPILPAPSNLAVTTIGARQVALSWSPVPGVKTTGSYQVYRATASGGPYASVASINNTTIYTDTGLTTGTTYYYVVRAFDNNVGSVNSNQVSAVPALLPPTNLVATAQNQQVTLAWNSVFGNEGYRVLRATATGGPYTVIDPSTPNNTNYVNNNLTNGTTYYYVVETLSNGNPSANSNEASAKPIPPPSPPTGLVTTSGNGRVDISWTATATATSYQIDVSSLNSSFSTYSTFASTPNNFAVGGANGTTYYFRVRAINNSGMSSNSATVAGAAHIPPPIISGLPGDSSVQLSWNAVSGATGYKIYRSQSSGTEGLQTQVTTTSWLDTGRTNGTTYYYVVTSYDSTDTGPASNEITVTPNVAAGLPGAPTFTNLDSVGATVVSPVLPVNTTSMALQEKVSGQPDTSYLTIGTDILGNSGNDVGSLIPGTTYTFRFQGIGPGGTANGTSANITIPSSSIVWSAGTGIQCSGIRFPWSGSTVPTGSSGTLSAFLATDWDIRNLSVDGTTMTNNYSDPCSYTWSSDGGSFPNGFTGQNVTWVAPTTPGTYHLALFVDDQNAANQPPTNTGSRNDATYGYNDDPVRFTATIIVQ